MIHFDAATHIYTDENGRRLPSVTQVLEPLTDFSKVPYDQLRRAQERGSLVHRAGELLIAGELDWSSIDGDIAAYVSGLKRFLDESGVVPIETEKLVHHRSLRYAGQLDLLGHWRNGYCLFDWKTSVVTPLSVGPQLYGYQEALHDTTGRRVSRHYCVRLFADGTYKVDRVDDVRNRSAFISALNLWKFKNEHAHRNRN